MTGRKLSVLALVCGRAGQPGNQRLRVPWCSVSEYAILFPARFDLSKAFEWPQKGVACLSRWSRWSGGRSLLDHFWTQLALVGRTCYSCRSGVRCFDDEERSVLVAFGFLIFVVLFSWVVGAILNDGKKR